MKAALLFNIHQEANWVEKPSLFGHFCVWGIPSRLGTCMALSVYACFSHGALLETAGQGTS